MKIVLLEGETLSSTVRAATLHALRSHMADWDRHGVGLAETCLVNLSKVLGRKIMGVN